MRRFAILLILSVGCSRQQAVIKTTSVHSPESNDTYSITKKVISTNKTDSTISIYILDAQLDHRVEEVYKYCLNKNTGYNYNIIGIGHEYFNKSKRKRDFVPPKSSAFFAASSGYYGQADNFLQFLTDSIVSEDSISDYRILVGHSFGGLFATYVSTLDQTHFQKCIAISPSLWVNHSSFLNLYQEQNKNRISTPLEIHFGGLEVFNKVAPSCKRFKQILTKKDQDIVRINEIKMATHKSILDYLPEILLK